MSISPNMVTFRNFEAPFWAVRICKSLEQRLVLTKDDVAGSEHPRTDEGRRVSCSVNITRYESLIMIAGGRCEGTLVEGRGFLHLPLSSWSPGRCHFCTESVCPCPSPTWSRGRCFETLQRAATQLERSHVVRVINLPWRSVRGNRLVMNPRFYKYVSLPKGSFFWRIKFARCLEKLIVARPGTYFCGTPCNWYLSRASLIQSTVFKIIFWCLPIDTDTHVCFRRMCEVK